MSRPTVFDWALSYTGDPESWETRGAAQLTFLRELGMRSEHRLLEIGCGCMSLGHAAIRFLHAGHYVGIEPNGWLVESWLQREEERGQGDYVRQKNPRFLWTSDFDASGLGVPFEFAFAHSVLSHAAHWQMPMMLQRVRDVMPVGGVLLASLRLGDVDTWSKDWAYPDVTFFRPDTVAGFARHAGFTMVHRPDLRERLVEVAPNDYHDWVVFEATDAERFHAGEDEDLCPAARREKHRSADLLDVLAETSGALEDLIDAAPLGGRHRTVLARAKAAIE